MYRERSLLWHVPCGINGAYHQVDMLLGTTIWDTWLQATNFDISDRTHVAPYRDKSLCTTVSFVQIQILQVTKCDIYDQIGKYV